MSFIFDTYSECVRFAENNNLTIEIRDHGKDKYLVKVITE